MSENTENIEQHAEGASRSLVELVNGGLQYPLEAYRIYSYLTRVAGEMGNALDLIGASLQGLHAAAGHLAYNDAADEQKEQEPTARS